MTERQVTGEDVTKLVCYAQSLADEAGDKNRVEAIMAMLASAYSAMAMTIVKSG